MATYNCSDSSINAYGAGGYGNCSTASTTITPNKGVLDQVIDSGGFIYLAPLAVGIIIAIILSFAIRR